MIQKLILLLCASGGSAWATQFAPQTMQEAVQGAQVVVHGTVGSSHVESPATLYDLQVTETIKGEAASGPITIRQPGAPGLHISGTADLRPGQDVVLFLTAKNDKGSYDIQGLQMGKLNVTGADGGLDGPEVILDRVLAQKRGEAPRERWTLADLRALAQSSDQPSTPQPTASATPASAPVAPSPSPLPTPSASAVAPQASLPLEVHKSVPTWVFVILVLGFALASRFWVGRKR